MVKSLFDEVEEKFQGETEEITQPEAKTEPEGLSKEEGLFEISDSNYAAINVETPIFQNLETTAEILPPTEIQILQDVEVFDETTAHPEISFTPAARKIDELRIQSNISNSRNPIFTTETQEKNESAFFQTKTKSESIAETARKSGLAMSAAIALFGSVVFLLIIGWFADLLLGTSPWGIVGGIVLGSVIGFLQFFRMTSQILKNKD